MKAIIFDAFGTLFKVTSGGSARTIMNNIVACGGSVDEKEFLEEWKAYYKKHTIGDSITDDVLGPKVVGIKTTWIDRNGIGGENGQDYTISDLSELLKNV